jgi:hypothetical protein
MADGEGRDRPVALIDGANAAHAGTDAPRLRNIRIVCDKLSAEGFQPIVVTDASLRHRIDDQDGYERLVSDGVIRQAPAGTDADYFLLSFSRELGAPVVSNDRFRDREEAYADVLEHVIRFMIVNEEVVLERRARPRRAGS